MLWKSIGHLLRERFRIRSVVLADAHLRESEYALKIAGEINTYAHVTNVANLPEIHGYWAERYVRPLFEPFGFSNGEGFYLSYVEHALQALPDRTVQIVTLGSGNCEFEVGLATELIAKGYRQFQIECLDINPAMLERGQRLAVNQNVIDWLKFSVTDINHWVPITTYDIVIANHALHHFVNLEHIFDQIKAHLSPAGYFLTHDMIGRNGHMRWPEALAVVNRLWLELPETYKYNHNSKRYEAQYINFDCSKGGFEGIRAQDILPLLNERFGFDLFVPFGNVIDIFVDRCFGHNFDVTQKWATDFIDGVQALDQSLIESGEIKPTHMLAAMCLDVTRRPRVYKHLTPSFCVRPV